jgi:DNA-binding transcriptional MerR regulator
MKRHTSILLSFLFLFLFNISFALTEKDFKYSMNFYQKLVEKKVSVEELIFTLEKIIDKYKDIDVNLTQVRGKLLTLRKFKISKDFYKKLEARRASVDERIATLKRILNKFRNIDVDLSEMEKKLEQLEALKAGKKEELGQVKEFRVEQETSAPKIEEDFEQGKENKPEIEEEFEEFKP